MLGRSSKGEAEPSHLFKLVLIGDSGVGKTSMLSRFVDNEYNDMYFSTIGVDFKARNLIVNDQKVKVQIWDTAGQERFRTITSSYYRGARGIMIVYNVADKLSFTNASLWLKEASKYSDPSTIKILVGNKADLPEEQRKVTYDEAKEFAVESQMLWIETSAKHGTNVNQAFTALCEQILLEQKPEVRAVSSRISIHDYTDITEKKRSNCC